MIACGRVPVKSDEMPKRRQRRLRKARKITTRTIEFRDRWSGVMERGTDKCEQYLLRPDLLAYENIDGSIEARLINMSTESEKFGQE